MNESSTRWYHLLTRYHWFVLVVAALGWLFDTMDQQLFVLARPQAMKELLAGTGMNPDEYGPYATAIFIFGWATGGLVFGVLGDRIGRAKTMMLTILVYSLFTGMSAFSVGFYDFALYRFLTGLGVGGEFAVGVALVAEVMPDRARPFALGLLQALSAVGNITAALITMSLGQLEESGVVGSWEVFGIKLTAWRLMFLIGTLPALLAIVIRRNLKEPEKWQAAKQEGVAQKSLGSYGALFGDPRWRKRAIVGLLLASSGVIGLWSVGFFVFDLNGRVLRQHYEQQARETGAAVHDGRLVRLAVHSPEAYFSDEPGSKPDVKPADLISENAKARDAELIYAATLKLRELKKPIDVDSVIAELDREDTGANRKAQSSEDRARRLAYLARQPDDPTDAKPLVKAVTARSGAINGNVSWWKGITSLMMNVAAFFGIATFSRVTHHLGRKPTFAIAFLAAFLSTVLTFWTLDATNIEVAGTTVFVHVFTTIPLMGFCQLSLFGGYAIYFPELFPTYLRSTGTSFCYNVGRYVTAFGLLLMGQLVGTVFGHTEDPLRYAGLTMCSIFLVGLLVLPFAPETKGQPLPE